MSVPAAKTYYAPGGAPFFIRGGDVGCLCLHGLTALPQEVRWLGQHLAGQGYTVYAPRIVGHGTTIRDLMRTRWQDWYGSALDAYTILRQQCRQVFVLGLSLGGVLSLHLGAREQPDGVVALAAPLEFDLALMPYTRYLKVVLPYATSGKPDENHLRIDRRMREIQAQRGDPVIGRASYGRFPTASVAELYALAKDTTARLSHLTAPLLLAYSEGDRTVPFRNMANIAGQVGTPKEHLRQLHLLESDHLLTLDVDMEQVFQAAAEFVAHYAN